MTESGSVNILGARANFDGDERAVMMFSSEAEGAMPEIGLLSFARVAYEDWTFREAEIGLREHRELRAVLRLSSAPDHTTVHRFLRRLPDATASATW